MVTSEEPTTAPRLTIGIPIRNGERSLVRPLESALAQRGVDIEVVVADNASDDGTEQLCRDYAARDARLRYHRHPENIGLLANFGFVVSAGRGDYHRWLGADDWLEPAYAQRCVAALDDDPAAVLVTTMTNLEREDGSTIEGGLRPGPNAADPIERFRQLLDLLNEGYRAIDPVYSTIRRSVLARTGLIRPTGIDTDQVLAAELALRGPWAFIDETLAGRQHPRWESPQVLAKRFGVPPSQGRARQLRLTRQLQELITDEPLTSEQRRRALVALGWFYLRSRGQVAGRAARRAQRLVQRSSDGDQT